jgi:hypothetical protein
MKISSINLDEVAYNLEGTGARRDEMTAQCDYCQASVKQTDNACHDCGAHVIWFNSRVWKREYGRPDLYEKRLTQDLTPKTPLQIRVVTTYGTDGSFSNITQKKKFIALERKFPDSYIENVFGWAASIPVPWSSFVSAVENTANYDRWLGKETQGVGQAKEIIGY